MRRKKILLVDDDADLLRALYLRLKANNYDTVFARDGYQATKMALTEKPDLIILDIGLPMGDGFIVMDRIREFIKSSMIPVIVLTGRDPAANKERALKAGATAFFQKPADNQELMACIARELGESDQE
ncbi:MAG: response regulator [Desulfobacteraceae bacterium]|jgi:two-component system KDP operon response regulator KdpE